MTDTEESVEVHLDPATSEAVLGLMTRLLIALDLEPGTCVGECTPLNASVTVTHA